MQSGDYAPHVSEKVYETGSANPCISNDNLSAAQPLPIYNDLSPTTSESPVTKAKTKKKGKKKKKVTKVIVIQEEVTDSSGNNQNNAINNNLASSIENNGGQVIIVNNPAQKKEIIGIQFPCCIAYLVLFINFILPGIGTMIGSCFITDPVLKASFCCSGCYELFMSFLLVGWCFALCHSFMFIGAAHSGMTFEEYHRIMNKDPF